MNTMTTTDHSEAWAFILRHTGLMERLAHRFGPRNPDDRTEWLNDVYLYIVKKHDRYDEAKSAPQTWIVWQMRAVMTNWTRRFKRRCQEGYGTAELMVMIPVAQGSHGSEEHARTTEREQDAESMVNELYSMATPKQQIAIRTHLAGLPATQLRQKHGMTGRQRTEHLRELRAHLE